MKSDPLDRIAELEASVGTLQSQVRQLLDRVGRKSEWRQARLAVTVAGPGEEEYPEPPADTFWIQLVDGSYTETPGDQAVATRNRSTAPRFKCHNVTGKYVAEGKLIEVQEINGQFWCEREHNAEDLFYALEDCRKKKPTIYAANEELANYIGMAVKIASDPSACWFVRKAAEGEAKCPTCVVVTANYPNCLKCNALWLLTRCDGLAEILTNTDLSLYDGGVVRLTDGYCYEVQFAPDAQSTPQPVTLAGDVKWVDCDACGCYRLQNCEDSEDIITVWADLHEAFTPPSTPLKVVRTLQKCWIPIAFGGDVCDEDTINIGADYDFYDTCAQCRQCVGLIKCDDNQQTKCVKVATVAGQEVPLVDYIGKVVRLDDHTCWRIVKSTQVTGCICTDAPDEVHLLEIYDTCEKCKCYALRNCEDAEEEIVTYSDLSAYGLNSVIKDQNGTCWEIIEVGVSCGENSVAVNVVSDHFGCDGCLGNLKFRLVNTNCQTDCPPGNPGPAAPDIVTSTDLQKIVGKFIKVGGQCYVVQIPVGDPPVTQASVTYEGPYDSCEACLAAPGQPTHIRVLIASPSIDGDTLKFPTANICILGKVSPGADATIPLTECPES